MSIIRVELKNDSPLIVDFGLEPEGDYFDIQPGSTRVVELDTASSEDQGISFSVQAPGDILLTSSMRKTAL